MACKVRSDSEGGGKKGIVGYRLHARGKSLGKNRQASLENAAQEAEAFIGGGEAKSAAGDRIGKEKRRKIYRPAMSITRKRE